MDVSRCFGIGIVMVIPFFVGAGAVWDIFNSWGAVIAWAIVIAIAYSCILYKGQIKRI